MRVAIGWNLSTARRNIKTTTTTITTTTTTMEDPSLYHSKFLLEYTQRKTNYDIMDKYFCKARKKITPISNFAFLQTVNLSFNVQ